MAIEVKEGCHDLVASGRSQVMRYCEGGFFLRAVPVLPVVHLHCKSPKNLHGMCRGCTPTHGF